MAFRYRIATAHDPKSALPPVASRGQYDDTGLSSHYSARAPVHRSTLYLLLGLFFAVFLVCAGLLQLRSGGLSAQKFGAIDQLNASLLWGSSVLALLIAAECRGLWSKFLLWFMLSAGFGALAIDEVFEFHEGTRLVAGDDDYIKIAAWGCAGLGAYLIHRVAQPAPHVLGSLAIAFGFTTAWLLADMGDGDFFTLPIPLLNLLWLEEYLELMASQFYITAFILHYRDVLSASQPARRAQFTSSSS